MGITKRRMIRYLLLLYFMGFFDRAEGKAVTNLGTSSTCSNLCLHETLASLIVLRLCMRCCDTVLVAAGPFETSHGEN